MSEPKDDIVIITGHHLVYTPIRVDGGLRLHAAGVDGGARIITGHHLVYTPADGDTAKCKDCGAIIRGGVFNAELLKGPATCTGGAR